MLLLGTSKSSYLAPGLLRMHFVNSPTTHIYQHRSAYELRQNSFLEHLALFLIFAFLLTLIISWLMTLWIQIVFSIIWLLNILELVPYTIRERFGRSLTYGIVISRDKPILKQLFLRILDTQSKPHAPREYFGHLKFRLNRISSQESARNNWDNFAKDGHPKRHSCQRRSIYYTW